MATNQASFFCPQCNQMKLFQQQTMNHTPHILASVFLCGLWLPVWILIAITDSPAWHCSFCGYSAQLRYLQDPNLRAGEQAERARHDQLRREQRALGQSIPIGEQIATVISNNKPAVALVAGLIVLVAVIGGVSVERIKSEQAKQVAADAAKRTAEAEASVRQRFAVVTKVEMLPTHPTIEATTTGPSSGELVFRATTINEKHVDEFRRKKLAEARRLGFVTVKFSNGPREWQVLP